MPRYLLRFLLAACLVLPATIDRAGAAPGAERAEELVLSLLDAQSPEQLWISLSAAEQQAVRDFVTPMPMLDDLPNPRYEVENQGYTTDETPEAGQYGATTTFSAGASAVSAGVLQPGSYEYVVPIRYRNIFDRPLFSYTMTVAWSFDGSGNITAATYSCTPSISAPVWRFAGHIDKESFGGEGHPYFQTDCTGDFELSFLKLGYVQQRTPHIEVTVNGGGGYKSTRQG
jgi:hypothetical protein